jgi:cytochrome P450
MTASANTRPESSIDLSDPVVNHDPYPYYEEIRSLGPAVWNPPSKAWLVTSFDHAKSVFANPKDFAQDQVMYEEVHGVVTLPGVDNPRHNDLRGIVGPLMSRSAAEGHAALAQSVIDRNLNPVFEQLRDGATVDVAALYRTISTEFVARTLGVPREDCGQFVTWAEQMAGTFDLAITPGREDAEEIRRAAVEGTRALNEYASAALDDRRRSGDASDLLGALATTSVPMTPEERIGYVTMVIQGGQDTSATWAKNITVALAEHPDQRSAVAADTDLVRLALDEVIRWNAPVTAEIRIVRNPGVEIGGIPVAQGDTVIMLLGATHRDPTRWDNPEKFDVRRSPKGNLGFGFGVHSCLGVNFARRLVTSMTETILREIPNYTVAIPETGFDFGRSYAVRGTSTLPLSLG